MFACLERWFLRTEYPLLLISSRKIISPAILNTEYSPQKRIMQSSPSKHANIYFESFRVVNIAKKKKHVICIPSLLRIDDLSYLQPRKTVLTEGVCIISHFRARTTVCFSLVPIYLSIDKLLSEEMKFLPPLVLPAQC